MWGVGLIDYSFHVVVTSTFEERGTLLEGEVEMICVETVLYRLLLVLLVGE